MKVGSLATFAVSLFRINAAALGCCPTPRVSLGVIIKVKVIAKLCLQGCCSAAGSAALGLLPAHPGLAECPSGMCLEVLPGLFLGAGHAQGSSHLGGCSRTSLGLHLSARTQAPAEPSRAPGQLALLMVAACVSLIAPAGRAWTQFPAELTPEPTQCPCCCSLPLAGLGLQPQLQPGEHQHFQLARNRTCLGAASQPQGWEITGKQENSAAPG